MSTFGEEIINRFPDRSRIHNPNNPGHIMIDSSIGEELDVMLEQLQTNSNARFLDNAKGIFLDRYGEWFGLPRGTLNDDEYRVKLLALRGSNTSINGIHGSLSIILDLDPSEIIIKNSDDNCCRLGHMILHDQYHSGTSCKCASHYHRDAGTIEITVPLGTDTSIAENIIDQMILPGVIVIFKEA